MATLTEVQVPDLGDFGNVPVIEVLVSAGEHVDAEDALITLESDKASMDVPAPHAGTIAELKVAVGDEVSSGAVILTMEVEDGRDGDSGPEERAAAPAESTSDEQRAEERAVDPEPAEAGGQIEVRVPDLGDFSDVPVIEVLVSPGDTVNADDALVTLESDKASMDLPSPAAGNVAEIVVSVGDKVSQGDLIAILGTARETVPKREAVPKEQVPQEKTERAEAKKAATEPARATSPEPRAPSPQRPPTAPVEGAEEKKSIPHATPSVRRFARELGVDLSQLPGTGRKGRILADDVRRYVKETISGGGAKAQGQRLPEMPAVDFSKFGEIETVPLGRIKKLTAASVHRSWLVVPHVTHHDEADITELEHFRKAHAEDAKKRGLRLTPLAFIMKAVVRALERFPTFNASLDPSGESLVLKHYYHLGIAVDTAEGLVVPVVRDVDGKSVEALAKELAATSEKAREKKLSRADIEGASFTISSLGGIGGTGFTPIVNAPEVAILGVSRSKMTPVYDGAAFAPRLMLPLSLSYDHRVVDGAEAARFTRYLCELLEDIRRLLL